jgi:hypothetical protein
MHSLKFKGKARWLREPRQARELRLAREGREGRQTRQAREEECKEANGGFKAHFEYTISMMKSWMRTSKSG